MKDGLWDKAAEDLSVEDKEIMELIRLHKLAQLNDVLKAVDEKREVCKEKRWKYTKSNGKVIIIRDLFDKIATWVKKIQGIGDMVVQYDVSGHAALPWAGVKLLIGVRSVVPFLKL